MPVLLPSRGENAVMQLKWAAHLSSINSLELKTLVWEWRWQAGEMAQGGAQVEYVEQLKFRRLSGHECECKVFGRSSDYTVFYIVGGAGLGHTQGPYQWFILKDQRDAVSSAHTH